LIRVTRLHVMRIRQLLQGLGLHPGHELLLMHLWDTGPQRQTDLAAERHGPASMTPPAPEKAGLLSADARSVDGRDPGRSTPAGIALRRRVEQLWARLEADTVGDMPASQECQLLRGLWNLETNLSSATMGDATSPPSEVDVAAPRGDA
jgi:DNA-binding MarR family transcriptional regulator